MCVDAALTTLEVNKPDTYCICCQMPYVEDDQLYGVCEDNHTLGDLGPGFPMFFEFIKYTGYMLFFLTLIYFVPAVVMINKAMTEVKGKLKPHENALALFSLGAFIHHADNPELDDSINWENRESWLKTYYTMLSLSILSSFCLIICIRACLAKSNAKLDKEAFTPSDYCVMGYNMYFDDCHPKTIDESIR
jgi:hypothetical protein